MVEVVMGEEVVVDVGEEEEALLAIVILALLTQL